MPSVLDFHAPFSGFCGTTFINCFTSAYIFLEKLDVTDDYACKQKDGQPCDGCGNCQHPEQTFFYFDTMCGRSSLRCRFDGARTEMEKLVCETDFYDGGTGNNIDFLFGLAGYAYRKLAEPAEFAPAIAASIEAGRPVIAKVKEGGERFRVIIGVDGGALIGPDYGKAQRKPERAPTYGELEALYLIGEKCTPRYTFRDGLERIRGIMEANFRENLWGGYIEKMGLYTADSLGKADLEEKKARMKRVAETMWHTSNCHNFAEVFRNAYHEDLRSPALEELRKKIGGPCHGYTHDLAWALIGLEERADWTRHYAHYFGEMVELTLKRIETNDAEALSAIREIIDMLDRNVTS